MKTEATRCRILWLMVACTEALTGPGSGAEITGRVVDAETGAPLAARVYVQSADGARFLVKVGAAEGSAIPYGKTNWINPRSVEVHTTVSAHPFRASLPAGQYVFTAERGKEYLPVTEHVQVSNAPVNVRLQLRRWINMAERGWFSGETHLHRTMDELRNVVLAEDLNVSFPLSFWITKAFTAPGSGDRNLPNEAPAELVRVDDTHWIWPRNTEYEIFTVGAKQHTLGALFILNHRTIFTNGVPPWGGVADQAKAEGAFLDMDKLDWAFACMLPPVTGAQLYELANNHMWRTEYAFTNYTSFAPPYLHPPYGSRNGGERDWTLYTFGMYYTLLNAGLRPVPTAGTANGVHPVPAGFSRVYVRLREGFTYERWLAGLSAGRSFVTTGPMLFAEVNGRDPGETFRVTGPTAFRIQGNIISEAPLSFIEVIQNGRAVRTIMPQNRITAGGARESSFRAELTNDSSGWMAVRCWEDRDGGRFRWAHSTPWHIASPGKTLQPRREEKDFLVTRMQREIARSRSVLPATAQTENEQALAAYEKLMPADDSAEVARQGRGARDEAELRRWLENMVWDHGFNAEEVRMATGLGLEEVHAAQQRFGMEASKRPSREARKGLRVIPYPGGRHPRMGFLDGALNPERDTKISVFTPWDERSYVVVDVPEAIWSNLGLTYLAHEHIPTIWTAKGAGLDRMEWNCLADSSLDFERVLPNGIAFGTKVVPGSDAVRMETWVRNGTRETLKGLRMQHCVMLKAAQGFHEQTSQNKILRAPYAVCRSEDGRRWIITAWDPLDGVWQNPPVPCMHANPKFPDCRPGETVRARGWLSFYEGEDLDRELQRIERAGWRTEPAGK
jgi:hypothetical protein